MTEVLSMSCAAERHGASAAGRGWPSGRRVVLLLLTAVVTVSAGCSSGPKPAADAKSAVSKGEPLSEFMSRAQTAEAAEGGRERARQIYRDAAKAYPADKRPWARLAQSYFDAGDYGNAVLAAQEVVQRDPQDSTAQGLLAVSGLRISTSALAALRNQNGISTSTRSEAEDMARNLRSILGESVLVPKPAEASATTAHTPPPQPKPRRAVVRNTAPPSAPVKAPPAPSSNPFGALQ